MAFRLRPATIGDAARIAQIYAPIVEQSWTSFEIEPPAAAEMARRLESVAPRWPWLVADDGSAIIGYAYAGEHRTRAAYRWSVDVSVYVAPEAQRGGTGRRLYHALFAILRAQGYYNAFAGIALPNDPSIAFHCALGFVPIGVYRNVGYKLGAWRDVAWYQHQLRPPDADVAEPRPFAELRARFERIDEP